MSWDHGAKQEYLIYMLFFKVIIGMSIYLGLRTLAMLMPKIRISDVSYLYCLGIILGSWFYFLATRNFSICNCLFLSERETEFRWMWYKEIRFTQMVSSLTTDLFLCQGCRVLEIFSSKTVAKLSSCVSNFNSSSLLHQQICKVTATSCSSIGCAAGKQPTILQCYFYC